MTTKMNKNRVKYNQAKLSIIHSYKMREKVRSRLRVMTLTKIATKTQASKVILHIDMLTTLIIS